MSNRPDTVELSNRIVRKILERKLKEDGFSTRDDGKIFILEKDGVSSHFSFDGSSIRIDSGAVIHISGADDQFVFGDEIYVHTDFDAQSPANIENYIHRVVKNITDKLAVSRKNVTLMSFQEYLDNPGKRKAGIKSVQKMLDAGWIPENKVFYIKNRASDDTRTFLFRKDDKSVVIIIDDDSVCIGFPVFEQKSQKLSLINSLSYFENFEPAFLADRVNDLGWVTWVEGNSIGFSKDGLGVTIPQNSVPAPVNPKFSDEFFNELEKLSAHIVDKFSVNGIEINVDFDVNLKEDFYLSSEMKANVALNVSVTSPADNNPVSVSRFQINRNFSRNGDINTVEQEVLAMTKRVVDGVRLYEAEITSFIEGRNKNRAKKVLEGLNNGFVMAVLDENCRNMVTKNINAIYSLVSAKLTVCGLHSEFDEPIIVSSHLKPPSFCVYYSRTNVTADNQTVRGLDSFEDMIDKKHQIKALEEIERKFGM